jgi:membrane AbrB-like protein
MAPPISLQREFVQVAETLLIAAVGGAGLALVGFPAGLITGSMLAVALASLVGRPMTVPPMLARVCIVLVGILLGAVVTPETLKGIATWPASVAILSVSAIGVMVAVTIYLRLVHKWDAMSALLGSSPGSMAQVLALAAEFKADISGIAIVHVMRVLLIVLGVPAGLALAGLTVDPAVRVTPEGGQSLLELAILVTVSAATAFALLWLRFPGGLMFGAMMSAAILHGGGFVHATLPWWLASAAIVMLGALAGSRFANLSARMLLSYLGAAVGSFAVGTAVAVCFGLIVVMLLPFRVADVAVAFAPGALDTMMVLALALHLDPVYVGAHHLVRFLVVSVAVALAARRMGRKPARERWRRPGQGTFDD